MKNFHLNKLMRTGQATGGAVTRDELLFPELYLDAKPVQKEKAT